MQIYFEKTRDTALLPKDIETMGELYSRFPEKYNTAALYYVKAASIEKESAKRIEYYITRKDRQQFNR